MDRKFTILVADKNRAASEFLKRELEKAGYDTVIASTGHRVIEAISAPKPPDLLLLDMELPDLNGPEVLKRAQMHRPPLPVIVHTFLTDEAERDFPGPGENAMARNGNIGYLKSAVADMLGRFYPNEFE